MKERLQRESVSFPEFAENPCSGGRLAVIPQAVPSEDRNPQSLGTERGASVRPTN